jgi:LysM repeat protein
VCCAALSLGGIVSWTPSPAEAAPRAASASEVIDAVNALRASYGLAPYIVDPILTAVAEKQNNYSISIGQITHYGPDGSRPRDQAIAAGYGGGATVFVSENIIMGTGLTPAEAVEWWTGDDPHLNTMIGANYRDVGAAVGQSDGAYYYTLLAGYVAGVGSAGSTAPGSQVAGSSGPAPVVLAAPQSDGSIVHTVEAGQTLWTIAAVYDVELKDLLQLNGLTETAVLHPGDQVVIQPGVQATATGVTGPSPSPERAATPTAKQVTPTVSPTPDAAPARNPASWALIVGGAALLLLGVVLGVRRT